MHRKFCLTFNSIGDIQRLAAPHMLVGYARLGVRCTAPATSRVWRPEHQAARRDNRSTMLKTARVGVGGHRYGKELFDRLAVCVGPSKAIFTIARKVLTVVSTSSQKRCPTGKLCPSRSPAIFSLPSWKTGPRRSGAD